MIVAFLIVNDYDNELHSSSYYSNTFELSKCVLHCMTLWTCTMSGSHEFMTKSNTFSDWIGRSLCSTVIQMRLILVCTSLSEIIRFLLETSFLFQILFRNTCALCEKRFTRPGDCFKIVPFSLFLIIPLAEFALPVFFCSSGVADKCVSA